MLFLRPCSKYVGRPNRLFTYEISDQKTGAEQKQRNVPVWECTRLGNIRAILYGQDGPDLITMLSQEENSPMPQVGHARTTFPFQATYDPGIQTGEAPGLAEFALPLLKPPSMEDLLRYVRKQLGS
jgi:hypothetical protein